MHVYRQERCISSSYRPQMHAYMQERSYFKLTQASNACEKAEEIVFQGHTGLKCMQKDRRDVF
jgi:hypothetical protein